MKYTYTAVFSPADDGGEIVARIPDLPGCVTTGDSLEDAIEQITDAASGCLVVYEDEGLDIPVPTPQRQLARTEGDVLSLVQVDTLAYRALTDTRSTRKNVSLPLWMANLADARGINFSQVLQEGLRARLEAR